MTNSLFRLFVINVLIALSALILGCASNRYQSVRTSFRSAVNIHSVESKQQALAYADEKCPYGYVTNSAPIKDRGRYSLDVACKDANGYVDEASRNFAFKENAYIAKNARGIVDWGALFHVVGAIGGQTAQNISATNGTYVPPSDHETVADRRAELAADHRAAENDRKIQAATGSQNVESNSAPAMGCVVQTGMQINNICARGVSVVWCTESEHYNCNRGMDMESDIPPNAAIAAAPLEAPGTHIYVRWFACYGSNTALAKGWVTKCD